MDEYGFHEESDENANDESKNHIKQEIYLEYSDKLACNKASPHNIENELNNNNFISHHEDLLSNELKFEDDFEPFDFMPLYKIGEKFGVSGKTVRKYCTKWGIKIPVHGSWIKKKEKK